MAEQSCAHIDGVKDVRLAARRECEECMRIGSSWVHLRTCQTCGGTRCCDSSPNRHATKHFERTAHPIIQSFEPGESWRWCYVDRQEV